MFYRIFVCLFIVSTCCLQASAQKFMSRDGHIWFHSSAPMEEIEAHNYQATAIIDAEKGDMAFSLLIKGFEFEKALMQEHFNEKYLESEKFPKSTFKGKLTNFDAIQFDQAGVYEAEVAGDLTIHGVTKPVTAKGTIEVKEGALAVKSKFQIAVADYEIKIPSVVRDNIAKIVDINIDITLEEYKR